MRKQSLEFLREMEMSIYYNGHDIDKRRVDFFIEQNIIFEIKATIKLEYAHLVQAMNYCSNKYF
jgi:GxxExxY protein